MSIKQSIQQIKQSDTRVYALVESAQLGLATIKLGADGSGNRISNIPYTGQLEVGDMVIYTRVSDYAYIEKIITAGVDNPITLLEADTPIVSPFEGGLPCGKLTSSGDQTEQFTNGTTGTWGWQSIIPPGPAGVQLNSVLYDSTDMAATWSRDLAGKTYNYTGFKCSIPGVYYLSVCVGIRTDLPVNRRGAGQLTIQQFYYNVASSSFLPGIIVAQDIKRDWSSGSNVLFLSCNLAFRLKQNDMLNIDLQYYYEKSSSATNYLTVVYDTNYPYFSWAMISPQDTTSNKSNRAYWQAGWYNEPNRV